MKGQWGLIISLIVAIIISVFAIINVESVPVNYLFGVAEWPLILVILGSVLMGALIAGAIGMFRIYQLQIELKRIKQIVVVTSSGENGDHIQENNKHEENINKN
ncbi:lipopolysaccharide assembly LapA domain-containing protein [Bacillus sp. JCM 19034]|uniref:LapA family protein n=1 Tax=Bacillus sp. JCM 19034 TaxID=1481928 RepID=UPI0007827846|nr:lipopolysaccharide assembly protein LapA domain-containing protein [Bacillus sp. JCM 19034]